MELRLSISHSSLHLISAAAEGLVDEDDEETFDWYVSSSSCHNEIRIIVGAWSFCLNNDAAADDVKEGRIYILSKKLMGNSRNQN